MKALSSSDERYPADRERAGNGNGRKVVLLVEDNDADRDIYGSLLWYNGFEVLHAANGEDALRMAVADRPDLILLDIMLPGELNGLDVAKRLRAEGLTTPIIVLSAVDRHQVGPEIDALDLSGYLEKPIEPLAVVREVIRRIGVAQDGA